MTGGEQGLKACPNPWCHSHERDLPLTWLGIAEVPIVYGRIGFRVRCIDCSLHGPTVERKGDAYAAWNQRPALSSSPPSEREVEATMIADEEWRKWAGAIARGGGLSARQAAASIDRIRAALLVPQQGEKGS